jgi:two-component system chemotaxis response regulator CheY
MASSVGTQNHLKAAIKAGASDFLQKPITNNQVKQILENAAKGVI